MEQYETGIRRKFLAHEMSYISQEIRKSLQSFHQSTSNQTHTVVVLEIAANDVSRHTGEQHSDKPARWLTNGIHHLNTYDYPGNE